MEQRMLLSFIIKGEDSVGVGGGSRFKQGGSAGVKWPINKSMICSSQTRRAEGGGSPSRSVMGGGRRGGGAILERRGFYYVLV